MDTHTLQTQRESFSERLKRLRKERGLTQIKLSEMVGVTDAWISQIEMGRAMPSPELINQFAQVLKVPVRELVEDQEEAMEIVARLKLIGVLVETNQPDQAEPLIGGLQGHPELTEVEEMSLTVRLAECRFQQRRYDEALAMLQPLILELETNNFHDAYLMAWIRNTMGKVFTKMQDFTNALYNYRKAYDYTHRFTVFDSLAARIAFNVGHTSRRIGNSQESIYYLNLAQGYFERNKDLKDFADTMYIQGLSHISIKDYARATECFEQARAVYHTIDNLSWANLTQLTIASSVTMETDPELALQQMNDCLSLLQRDKNFLLLMLAYAKIAETHLLKGNLESAHDSLQQANELLDSHAFQHTPEAGELYRITSLYHLQSKDFATAIDTALKASDLFDTIGLVKNQVESLRTAVAAYEELGDPSQALFYEKKRNALLTQLNERRGSL